VILDHDSAKAAFIRLATEVWEHARSQIVDANIDSDEVQFELTLQTQLVTRTTKTVRHCQSFIERGSVTVTTEPEAFNASLWRRMLRGE
jgi:hypothetical protein